MKVIAFIDGFNLYHSLIKGKETSKCQWLNLQSLCKSFLF